MAHLPKGQGIIPMPPFMSWLSNNIPAVYDNTMTYYEELCSLIKYLEDVVVPAVNANAEALTVVSNALEQLKQYVDNYFANLDVQEEINNKLDEMAEAGTLQEIITAYIQANVAWTFDTVADMKLAENLVAGSYAQTLGFYTKDDGGAGLYYITDSGTANEMDIIAIDSLYANLVGNKHYNAKQFGAKGDGSTDDTASLQQAVDVTSIAKGKLTISDGTYMVDAVTMINLKSNIEIDFVNAKLKAIATDQATYRVLYAEDVHDIILNNPVIEGDREEHTGATGESGHALYFRGNVYNVIVNSAILSNCWGDGVGFHRGVIDGVSYVPNHIYFNGVTSIRNVRRNGVSVLAGEHIYFDTLLCDKLDGTAPEAGIDLESEHDVDHMGNIYINTLNVNNSMKAFTLRSRGLITGNIHIGTIIHTNKILMNPNQAGAYDPSFRVFFEYFNSSQAKYCVSVDEVYTESQTISVENLYNDVTPQVVIGKIHSKTKYFISSTTPATTRSYIDLIYSLTTDTSTTLGGLLIDEILIDNAVSANNNEVTNIRPFKLTYNGSTALTSLKATNIKVGNIRVNTVDEYLVPNICTSNVVCDNVVVNFEGLAPVVHRKDSGNTNYRTAGDSDIYEMPVSDPTSSKSITLRVQNVLKPFKIYLTGNTTFIVNTAYDSTNFTKVYLNSTEVVGSDGVYTIGAFSTGGSFYVYTKDGYIYIEQLS